MEEFFRLLCCSAIRRSTALLKTIFNSLNYSNKLARLELLKIKTVPPSSAFIMDERMPPTRNPVYLSHYHSPRKAPPKLALTTPTSQAFHSLTSTLFWFKRIAPPRQDYATLSWPPAIRSTILSLQSLLREDYHAHVQEDLPVIFPAAYTGQVLRRHHLHSTHQ